MSRIGYRVDVPEWFFNRYWLERKVEQFDLDDQGLCPTCHTALGRATSPG
jgi:hypothetical protein